MTHNFLFVGNSFLASARFSLNTHFPTVSESERGNESLFFKKVHNLLNVCSHFFIIVVCRFTKFSRLKKALEVEWDFLDLFRLSDDFLVIKCHEKIFFGSTD